MSAKKINFDEVNDRRGSNCGRWDTMDLKYRREDMIHLGVADMDFKSPTEITGAFHEILDKGIYGYTDLSDKFYSSIQGWMKRRHGVDVKKPEIVFCPRINIASSISIEALTEEGDEVIINTPAYGPLYQAIVKNNRVAVESPLILEDGDYRMDLEHLETVVTEKTKMFILCSPHNPTGKVWTEEELKQIGDFCVKHQMFLFVDEIHSDILAEGVEFISALSLSDSIRSCLIMASSLTKTFNVPGVIVSYMIIPDEEIQNKLRKIIDTIGMHNPTIFAVAAVEHGYTECDQWYEEMLAYINENEKFTRKYFAGYMPEFQILKREGTYLLWISYEQLGCSEETLERWFIDRANVSVYMGSVFGEAGKGFIRLNIASPRKVLEEAYGRMAKVYSELKQ